MKNLYGTIGFTILKNNQTTKKIIIFADKHDNLPSCFNKTDISAWIKTKFDSSKIMLEEVPRETVNLQELWSDSTHTQDLKKIYLENPQQIDGLDIRPLLIPFSWELILDNEIAHNITIKKYIIKINNFFCVNDNYLLEKLSNYQIDKLKGTKLGIHFLTIKKIFKKIVETNSLFLNFRIKTIKIINIELLESINDLLDQIMEWYICANIDLNNTHSIIIHAGLAHSEKIVLLLTTHYDYSIVMEQGINKLIDVTNVTNRTISGCIQLPTDMERQFGGFDNFGFM